MYNTTRMNRYWERKHARASHGAERARRSKKRGQVPQSEYPID